jgi:hypothetical protein
MKPNKHEEDRQREAIRKYEEAKRRFEELLAQPCPSIRPRMTAIQVDNRMALAIERNPTSLKMWATDPETGVEVVARPYAATGGAAVLLGVAGKFDVYGVVGR